MRKLLDEDFDSASLDLEIWVPYHLPHWSSRDASAAVFEVGGGELRLWIPEEHPLWCPDTHIEPLRVSGIQSGTFSGPVGSTVGPQPFADGLVVRSEEPTMWGYTPTYGEIQVRMKGIVFESSMFAVYMSGVEDQPERAGEICLAEIFGRDTRDGRAGVGIGIKKLGDPTLVDDFEVVELAIDPREYHLYSATWTPDGVSFAVDGEEVRHLDQSPNYPMQLNIAVFDFPAKRRGGDSSVPEMTVSHVGGRPLT